MKIVYIDNPLKLNKSPNESIVLFILIALTYNSYYAYNLFLISNARYAIYTHLVYIEYNIIIMIYR